MTAKVTRSPRQNCAGDDPLLGKCVRCGKGRKLGWRNVCRPCYVWLQAKGQLDLYPLIKRPRQPGPAVRDRILANSEKTTDGCWLWTGALTRGNYPNMGIGGRTFRAHRVAYEEFVGPIPDGLEIDHMCHNRSKDCPGGDGCLHRRCVNPEHLTPATRAENQRRVRSNPIHRTHCPQGHEYNAENTRIVHRSTGRTNRACRACATEQARRAAERAKARQSK